MISFFGNQPAALNIIYQYRSFFVTLAYTANDTSSN